MGSVELDESAIRRALRLSAIGYRLVRHFQALTSDTSVPHGAHDETSFDFGTSWTRVAFDRCSCELCRYVERVSGLQPKKLGPADKARATRLEAAFLERLVATLGLPAETARALAADPELGESIAIRTYTDELLRRLEGHVEGPAVLVLWRRFAWTRAGSPKKGFELTAERVYEAQRRLCEAAIATSSK